jgi:putative oxidoreductase
MTSWLNRLQPCGVLILRLVLGVAMVVHGYPKVVPPGGFHSHNYSAALARFAHTVTALGLPYWFGYVSAFTEFLGGIFLILGLLTRFCAFLVTIDMLFALAIFDLRHGYSASEYPLALAAIAFMLLLTGPGDPALDRKIGLV